MMWLLFYLGVVETRRARHQRDGGATSTTVMSTRSGSALELVTESTNDDLMHLDTLPVAEIAAEMNRLDHGIPLAVQSALPQIVPAIEGAAAQFVRGGRLVY